MAGPYEPDRFEKGVRFGCGALFGVVVGIVLALQLMEGPSGTIFCDFVPACRVAIRYLSNTHWAYVATIAGTAVLCGALAVRFGERFWASGIRAVLWIIAWF